MPRHVDFKPPGLTELLLLVAIAVLLGFAVVPHIDAYFYRLKAKTVVTRYLDAVRAVQRDIRHATAGRVLYFVRTDSHSGLFALHGKLLHHAATYAVGSKYTVPGVIYLSHASFILAPNIRFADHYFQRDPDLMFLYRDWSRVGRPLRWPAMEISGDAAQDAGSFCKGNPVVVTVGMNFDYRSRNRNIRSKVGALLRKNGFKPHNDTVAVAINTQGAVCNVE